jgi:hypothetical protein
MPRYTTTPKSAPYKTVTMTAGAVARPWPANGRRCGTTTTGSTSSPVERSSVKQ